MARNKNIYCIYCKTKNNKTLKKCSKCHKKLNPKENLLLDYMKNHIKDDLKGKTKDTVVDIIKNFIISHLYGTFFAASLIFSLTSSIVNAENYEKIYYKPVLEPVISNKCEFSNSTMQIKTCENGYTLTNDEICIKEETIDAKRVSACDNGYKLGANCCISDETFEKNITNECIAPEGENYLDTTVIDGECLVKVCAGWTDGECSAGTYEPISFTVRETCPSGTTLINNNCKKVQAPKTNYTCEEGILIENKCLIKNEKEYTLTCTEGYTFNEECNVCVGE